MKISMISVGVTQDKYLKEGIAIFEKRINRYVSFELLYLPEPRNMKNQPENVQKELEGKTILHSIARIDQPVLLDVSGKVYSSEGFSIFLQQFMNKGTRNLAFIIGGPYGFSDEVYRNVTERLSVSSMTFSHQLIRLLFVEQLYRAFTIIKGEPYHHA
jgi:23S rRNA (pseudouridine1915-N3)-methyltransferase